MPLPSQADNNVPFLANRSRYHVVTTTPTWCYHRMTAGLSLSGEAPRTTTVAEADLDPQVTAGKAEFLNLQKGGLFTLQANAKRPLVIDALDNPGSATVTIVPTTGTGSRAAPAVPFKIGAGEMLKAVGGSTGGFIGVLYRIDGQEIW